MEATVRGDATVTRLGAVVLAVHETLHGQVWSAQVLVLVGQRSLEAEEDQFSDNILIFLRIYVMFHIRKTKSE